MQYCQQELASDLRGLAKTSDGAAERNPAVRLSSFTEGLALQASSSSAASTACRAQPAHSIMHSSRNASSSAAATAAAASLQQHDDRAGVAVSSVSSDSSACASSSSSSAVAAPVAGAHSSSFARVGTGLLRHPETQRLVLTGSSWGAGRSVASGDRSPSPDPRLDAGSRVLGVSLSHSSLAYTEVRRLVLAFLTSSDSRLFGQVDGAVEVTDGDIDDLMLAGGSFTLLHLQRLNSCHAQFTHYTDLVHIVRFLARKSRDTRERLFAYLNQHTWRRTTTHRANDAHVAASARTCRLFAPVRADTTSSSPSSSFSSYSPFFSWSDVDTLYVECLAGDAALDVLRAVEDAQPDLRLSCDTDDGMASTVSRLSSLLRDRFLTHQETSLARRHERHHQAAELRELLRGFEAFNAAAANPTDDETRAAQQAAACDDTQLEEEKCAASSSGSSSGSSSANAYAYLSPLVSFLSSPHTHLFRGVVPLRSRDLVDIVALCDDRVSCAHAALRRVHAQVKRAATASVNTVVAAPVHPRLHGFDDLRISVDRVVREEDAACAALFRRLNQAPLRLLGRRVHIDEVEALLRDTTDTLFEPDALVRAIENLCEAPHTNTFGSIDELARHINATAADLVAPPSKPPPSLHTGDPIDDNHTAPRIIAASAASSSSRPSTAHRLTVSAKGSNALANLLASTAPSSPAPAASSSDHAKPDPTLGYASSAHIVGETVIGVAQVPSRRQSLRDAAAIQVAEEEAREILAYLRSQHCHLLEARDEPASGSDVPLTSTLASVELVVALQRVGGIGPSSGGPGPRSDMARHLAAILRDVALWRAEQQSRSSPAASAAVISPPPPAPASHRLPAYFVDFSVSPTLHVLTQLEVIEARFGRDASMRPSASSASSASPSSSVSLVATANVDLLMQVVAHRRSRAQQVQDSIRGSSQHTTSYAADLRRLSDPTVSWLAALPPSEMSGDAAAVRSDSPPTPPSFRLAAVELALVLLRFDDSLPSRLAAITSLNTQLRELDASNIDVYAHLATVESMLASVASGTYSSSSSLAAAPPLAEDAPVSSSSPPGLLAAVQMLLSCLRAHLVGVDALYARALPAYLAHLHPVLELMSAFYTALYDALRAVQMVDAKQQSTVDAVSALHPRVALLLPLLHASFEVLARHLSARHVDALHAALHRLGAFTLHLSRLLERLTPVARSLQLVAGGGGSAQHLLREYEPFLRDLPRVIDSLTPFVDDTQRHLARYRHFADQTQKQYRRFVRPLLLPLLPLLVPLANHTGAS